MNERITFSINRSYSSLVEYQNQSVRSYIWWCRWPQGWSVKHRKFKRKFFNIYNYY